MVKEDIIKQKYGSKYTYANFKEALRRYDSSLNVDDFYGKDIVAVGDENKSFKVLEGCVVGLEGVILHVGVTRQVELPYPLYREDFATTEDYLAHMKSERLTTGELKYIDKVYLADFIERTSKAKEAEGLNILEDIFRDTYNEVRYVEDAKSMGERTDLYLAELVNSNKYMDKDLVIIGFDSDGAYLGVEKSLAYIPPEDGTINVYAIPDDILINLEVKTRKGDYLGYVFK